MCVCVWAQQSKNAASATREWTEQETLLLLEVLKLSSGVCVCVYYLHLCVVCLHLNYVWCVCVSNNLTSLVCVSVNLTCFVCVCVY